MTKGILEKKMVADKPLHINDLSASEKKPLLDFLISYGITSSTFYARFFQKGFSRWELLGIDVCMREFLMKPDVKQSLQNYIERDVCGKELGVKGCLFTLAQKGSTCLFYNCLKRANDGLCISFYSYMKGLGMSSTTVIKRFTAEDWKPWEQIGIENLLIKYNQTLEMKND